MCCTSFLRISLFCSFSLLFSCLTNLGVKLIQFPNAFLNCFLHNAATICVFLGWCCYDLCFSEACPHHPSTHFLLACKSISRFIHAQIDLHDSGNMHLEIRTNSNKRIASKHVLWSSRCPRALVGSVVEATLEHIFEHVSVVRFKRNLLDFSREGFPKIPSKYP